MAGSCARVIGPILFTWIYESFGTYATFGIIAGTTGISLVLYIIFFKRFVTFEEAQKRKAEQQSS